MAICRACLAEGKEMLQMDEDFVNKFYILTNLDLKPLHDTHYTCQECSEAVNFCIEFRKKCIASNLTFKSFKKAKENVTAQTPNDDEDQIIVKEELKVEYDDTKIEYQNLDDFLIDDDEIALSKLSLVYHTRAMKFTEKENSRSEVKSTRLRTASRIGRKKVANNEVLKVTKVSKAPKTESSETEPCGLCTKTLKNVEDLKKHLEHHKVDVPCNFCPQHFISLPHLYSHRILHIPEDKRRCHLCKKMAWNIEFLEFHYMRVHNMANKNEPIRCKVCTTTCNSVRQMHRHMKNHEELKFKCKVCHKSFARQNTLQNHAFVHNTENNFQCDKCDFVTHYPKGLAHHQLRKHTEGRVYCKVCRRPFRSQAVCDTHKCKTSVAIVCSICGFVAKDDKSARGSCPVNNIPLIKIYGTPLKKVSEFKYLGHLLTSDLKDDADIERERRALSVRANMITRRFARCSRENRKHKSVHESIKRYKCELCPAKFRSKSSFSIHRDKHAGKPRQICSFCGRAFYSASVLIKHRRVHTGEKPYVCEVCNKGFTANHNLKVHMKIHGIYNLIKSKNGEDTLGQ